MRQKILTIGAALALILGAGAPAHALSVDHSGMANSDGTSRFSDPDDQYESGALFGFTQQPGLSLTPHQVRPAAPPAPDRGGEDDCSGDDCAGE